MPVFIDTSRRVVAMGCHACGASVELPLLEEVIQEHVPTFLAQHPAGCSRHVGEALAV